MKNSSLLIRTIIIIIVALLGIYMVFGPRGSVTSADFTLNGIRKNVSENINLGLDLRGGSHLVMRILTDKYLEQLTQNNQSAALNAATAGGLPVSGATFTAQNNTYEVTLNVTDPARTQEVIDAVKQKVDFSSWTENAAGNTVTWSLPLQAQRVLKEDAVAQAERIIESRIDAFGVKEPTFARHGASDSGQLLLQMPGVEDPERIKDLIRAESRLSLMKIISPPNPSPVQTYATREEALQSLGGTLPPNRLILPLTERDENAAQNQPEPQKQWVVVETPAVVEGDELRDASAVSRTGNEGDYQIAFSFKPTGAQKFGDWTGKNIGNYMAVVLNDEVKSAAYIRSQIFDQGEISGRFTKGTAEDLALTLKSGALPAQIEYQEERTVGPSLGADSIRAGVTASIGGLAFVIVFMLIYYRGAGINAVIALLLNMLLVMAGLVMFGSTLTLPGIAGLILGIGMAVDSNVLIFERMREEIRKGSSVANAVEQGFDRALVTIIDSNVTTIIAAAVLYLYGSRPIRGFAVTLILGLLINLFTSVYVSRTIFMWLLQRNPNMKEISI